MFNKLKCLLLVFVIGIVSIVGTKSVNALPESISGVNAGSLISYDGGPRLYHKTYGNGVVFFMLMFNLFTFIVNKGKHKESYKRLSSYKEIEQSIKEKMCNLMVNTNGEKSTNCSLEFTNAQMTMDHEEWVKNIGDYYDFNADLETIRNSKVLIRK